MSDAEFLARYGKPPMTTHRLAHVFAAWVRSVLPSETHYASRVDVDIMVNSSGDRTITIHGTPADGAAIQSIAQKEANDGGPYP